MTTIHDLVFGPPAPGRGCGGCTACCGALHIDEPDLFKPADQPCRHCTGSGCGLYERRPALCRDWHCAWMRIPTLPGPTRPDRLGVIFTLDRQAAPQTLFDRLYIVGRAVSPDALLDGALLRSVMAMFVKGPLPVFFAWGALRQLVHPHSGLADAILDPLGPRDPQLVEQGRRWVAAFTPFLALADEAARDESARPAPAGPGA